MKMFITQMKKNKKKSGEDLDRDSSAFDAYRSAFSQLKTDEERLEKSKDKFDDAIEQFDNKEFIEAQKSDFDAVFDEQEAMKKQIKRLSDAYDKDMRIEIFNLFKDIFNNVRSKNHGLCKIPGENWEVTCGKKGFARRDNVQAQDLRERDMWKILEHADLIAKHLEKNNMELQAKQLKKFAEHAPSLDSSRSSDYSPVIELENPVYYPHSNWGTDYTEPKLAEHIKVSRDQITLYSNYEYEVEEDDYEYEVEEDDEKQTIRNGDKTDTITLRSRMHNRMNANTAICWMQLKPQIQEVFDETREFCKKQADSLHDQHKKLKKEFAKWVMMQQL